MIRLAAGAAAVGVAAFGAWAQNSQPAVKAVDGAVSPASVMDFKEGDFRFAFPSDLPASIPVNRGSPPVGGGCQIAGVTNGLNYGTLFQVADNFNVATTGQFTAVSWSAAYRAGTCVPGSANCPGSAGVAFTNGTPPATETFIIRILSDNAGVPGAVVPGGVFNVSTPAVVRTNSGASLGANPALTIWDYVATGLNGPVLNAGTCYWLEIQNTSVLPGGTSTNVSFWVTANPVPGDTVGYLDDTPSSIAGCGGYDAADQVTLDMTFCVNLGLNNLDGLNCPIATLPPICNNATTNGTGVDSAANVGFNSASQGSVYPATITGVFQRAENFSVTTAGNLQNICFWGFFGGTGLTANSCARDFDIIIWNNSPATGQPGTVRGQVKVGTTPGVTLSRSLDASGDEVFSVSLGTANQVALAADTCYHLTVSNQFVTTDAPRSARFFWGTTPAATALGGPIDGRFWSRAIPSNGTPGVWQLTELFLPAPNNTVRDGRSNVSFLLDVGPAGAPVCIPPPPGNDACATATTLPLTGAIVAGSNVNAAVDLLPGTAFDLVDGAAVWYSFIGTGNNVTITTCNTGSALDSVLHVYCAPNGCAGPFNRVGGNDDAAPACAVLATASTVTVPTISGTQYYVVVNGFQGAQNTFNLSATQGAASTPTPVCTPNCDLTSAPFDVAEAEACQAGADTNATCATAANYPALGDTAKGSVSTTAGIGGTRDIDLWRMPAAANGQTVVVALQSENPVLVQFQNDASGTCTTANTVVANTTFGFAACVGLDVELFEVTLPATGSNFFLITTPSFAGSTCAQGLDEYRFEIRVPAVGACCLASTACFVTTFTDCDNQSTGDPLDFWAEAVTCAVMPCDSQPGRCCFTDGTCTLVPSGTIGNAAACAAASGTYTAGAVCAPNTCPVSTNIACCRGTTCTLEPIGACAGPNTVATTATACNVAGNNVTPCCKADFNHVGGVTVQDIFDFLGAYFSGNPLADINGVGGVTVQDIFDFLGAYFAGCP